MSSTSTPSSTSVGGIVAMTGTLLNATAKVIAASSTDVPDRVHVPEEPAPMFLQTKMAQGIAGFFVWVALFLSCQQVRLTIIFSRGKYFVINCFRSITTSVGTRTPPSKGGSSGYCS